MFYLLRQAIHSVKGRERHLSPVSQIDGWDVWFKRVHPHDSICVALFHIRDIYSEIKYYKHLCMYADINQTL